MLAPHLGQQAVAAHPEMSVHRLTIDRDLQASLESLAADRVATLGPKLSVAIVVADEMSGAILASVGSAGLFEEARGGYVDMTRAERSPGSTLKPLIYGLAFEAGLAHPESLIEDRPTGFGAYAPQNFDGFHRGTVTVREALTQSLNVPAVDRAECGRPGAADGAAEARGGDGGHARYLRARPRRRPRRPRRHAPRSRRALRRDRPRRHGGGAPRRRRRSAAAGDRRAGAVAGRRLVRRPISSPDVPPPINGSPGRVAYKTGTSYGYRDAWAIGFDGAHVVGVWVGRPDGTPVAGLSGVVTAAPILFEAFDRVGPKRTPLEGASGRYHRRVAPPPCRRRSAISAGRAKPTIIDRDMPEIAYPQDGVMVDLGIKAGDPSPLVIKIRNGAPPFTFFVNGSADRAGRRLPAPKAGSPTARVSSRCRWSTRRASPTA